jgi:hypothetical protein
MESDRGSSRHGDPVGPKLVQVVIDPNLLIDAMYIIDAGAEEPSRRAGWQRQAGH